VLLRRFELAITYCAASSAASSSSVACASSFAAAVLFVLGVVEALKTNECSDLSFHGRNLLAGAPEMWLIRPSRGDTLLNVLLQ
jgi:hypothetical protein